MGDNGPARRVGLRAAPGVGPRAEAGAARRAGGVLFAGSLLGAALGYVFFVVLGRALAPEELGAVGSLINVATIASVPGLGLQLVTARAVAQDRRGARDAGAAMIGSLVVGLALAVTLVLLSPAITALLHLPGPLPVLALAGSAVPMTMAYVGFGLLQGSERLAGLGVCLLAVGATKLAASVIAVALGAGVAGVMGWYAAGWVATLGIAWWLCRPVLVGGAVAGGGLAGGGVRTAWPVIRSALQACVPTAGLLVLSSLDLLLARHYLSGDESGAYTIGALFEKVAFWGPSFLATMYYAQMAQPQRRRRAVLTALGATLAVGVVGIVIAAVAGGPLVGLVGGSRYAELGPLAWVFVALGVGLAVAQVLVYADIAGHGRGVGALVWVAVLACGAAVWWRHESVAQVVTAMAIGVACLVVLAGALVVRSLGDDRRHTDPRSVTEIS